MAAGGTEGPASPLLIRLFGPFEARRDGEPLPPLRTRKGHWLLALLTLHHGRPLEREWLAGTLWPDSPEPQALYNLRRSLSDLRRALGTQAHRLQVTPLHSLFLDLTGAEVDVIAFDKALARGDEPALEAAVGLYKGPLLEGCDEEWAVQEREARERSYLAALERLAACATSRSDDESAALFLQRAVAANPFRETAQRALMAALTAAGDTAAAILVYRELHRRLHREMNAEPSRETRELFERLRSEVQRRAVPGCSRSGGPGVPVTADRPSSTLEPGTRPKGNLPQPLSAFVGREKEPLEVGACLAGARLVTLIGTGGIGKTRLAIRVAEEYAGEYADGAWFVDLASLTDPALVPQAVARALRVREVLGCPLAETVQEALGTRQLLLLLDNCEHLIAGTREAGGCAHLANALLSRCPHLRILATSRQALGLTGEITWPVSPLSLPEPAAPEAPPPTPEALLEFEAIHLFVERAAAVSPGFKLGERNAAATVQICRRLDGIPLAIELAAARLKVLSIEQIAARLDDRFQLLTGGSRAALPRQQTLRATLDWSYDLLSEPERILMRRLSVFTGGFTLEAAEAVCSGVQAFRRAGVQGERTSEPERLNAQDRVPAKRVDFAAPGTGPGPAARVPPPRTPSPERSEEVLDLLSQLVDKSLVQVERREGAVRYTLLETTREYARERLLEAGEAAATAERHLAFFQTLAEAAEPQLMGPRQAEWLDRLEREHDNLRTALAFSRAAGSERAPEGAQKESSAGKATPLSAAAGHSPIAEMGLRLAGALWRFWSVRGYLTEGREHLAQALARAPAPTPGRAKALETAGSLAYRLADYRSARTLQEESLTIRRQSGDWPGIAASLRNLGLIAGREGEHETARSFHEESLAVSRELGNEWWIAASLHDLGFVAYKEGEYGAARSLHQESLAIRRRLGDRVSISDSLYNLGCVALHEGDLGAARSLFEESLILRRELGDRRGIGTALHHLGVVACCQGEYREARALHGESLAIRRQLGDRRSISESLHDLGCVACHEGDLGAARSYFEESLAIRRELGDAREIVEA